MRLRLSRTERSTSAGSRTALAGLDGLLFALTERDLRQPQNDRWQRRQTAQRMRRQERVVLLLIVSVPPLYMPPPLGAELPETVLLLIVNVPWLLMPPPVPALPLAIVSLEILTVVPELVWST